MASALFDEKVDILGSKISVWDLAETIAHLGTLASRSDRHYVCVSNVHTVVMGSDDPSYASITNGAALATADGVPLVWASRLLKGKAIHGRASGPDILEGILANPAHKKIRHYFYGSTPEVLISLKARLELKVFDPTQLAGFHSPPLRSAKAAHEPLTAEEQEECSRINDAAPQIVWVGLGAPKQEVWMHRARPHLKAPVLVGVGAAFDFLAGAKKRAPLWMQKAGLEWAFRLSQEPQRLVARYFKTNPVFVGRVLRQALLGK